MTRDHQGPRTIDRGAKAPVDGHIRQLTFDDLFADVNTDAGPASHCPKGHAYLTQNTHSEMAQQSPERMARNRQYARERYHRQKALRLASHPTAIFLPFLELESLAA